MEFWSQLHHHLSDLREFVAPSYHPERHYMRGPGPACARLSGRRLEAVRIRIEAGR